MIKFLLPFKLLFTNHQRGRQKIKGGHRRKRPFSQETRPFYCWYLVIQASISIYYFDKATNTKFKILKNPENPHSNEIYSRPIESLSALWWENKFLRCNNKHWSIACQEPHAPDGSYHFITPVLSTTNVSLEVK